jgi:hypothetical protein
MRIRVKLYSKNRPRAEQSPASVTIEIPNGAREFEHASKRCKVVGQQGLVHEDDKSGSLETDAIECWNSGLKVLNQISLACLD